MNTYLMKKAMIEAAVDRGIKDMEDDPERSLRRLTDLGKQFSKNRFQEMVFSVMQELLDNENSAYYDMMHNVLKNSDHDALKKFGVNFGYMGWTYGAGKLRKIEAEQGFRIPWTMLLRYDPSCDSEGGLTIDRLAKLMEQGQELGIYVYFIRQTGDDNDSYQLLTLLERYKECAYVWFKDNGRLTAAQIQMLKLCKNTVVSLPLEDPETTLTAALLKDQKIPFSLHTGYSSEKDFDESGLSRYMENVLTTETCFFFLIANDDATYSAAKMAYDSRLQQKYPCLIMDYYGDAESITKIVCEHDSMLEIDTDGRILLPDKAKGEPFPFELPLADALKTVMPPFQPPKQDS